MTVPRITTAVLTLSVPLLAVAGCTGKPNQANIELRKQNQELRGQVDTLTRERDTARADAAAARAQQPTVQTLPADRLAKLVTTQGLELGRLTGGADLDPAKPGDEGLKVYAIPTDAENQPIKAAGAIVIEAFDLAAGEGGAARVGRWEFDVEQAAKNWIGRLLRYEYVLPCPFEKPPAHADLTVKVTFTDELTGRSFSQQKLVTVKLPG